jgi:uncharacterized 2Fe-2S/4Fe-4S cluster protein (DUF4445 family)
MERGRGTLRPRARAAEGRRLGCQATVQGDIVIDVPPESQVHRQVVRKAASARPITMDPATRIVLVEVRSRTCTNPLAIWSA